MALSAEGGGAGGIHLRGRIALTTNMVHGLWLFRLDFENVIAL